MKHHNQTPSIYLCVLVCAQPSEISILYVSRCDVIDIWPNSSTKQKFAVVSGVFPSMRHPLIEDRINSIRALRWIYSVILKSIHYRLHLMWKNRGGFSCTTMIVMFNSWFSLTGWFHTRFNTLCSVFAAERLCMWEMHIDVRMYLWFVAIVWLDSWLNL